MSNVKGTHAFNVLVYLSTNERDYILKIETVRYRMLLPTSRRAIPFLRVEIETTIIEDFSGKEISLAKSIDWSFSYT